MKYKNTTERDLTIPEYGVVKAGATVELPDTFHNANFERVVSKTEASKELKVEDNQ